MNHVRDVLLACALVVAAILIVRDDATTGFAQTPTPTPLPAGTTCQVAGVTIPCDAPGITAAHPPACPDRHYHGTLSDVADPDPRGCGHGPVSTVAPAADGHGFWHNVYEGISALLTGAMGFSPKEVQESVEIVADAAPAIAENAENAEEYFEVYPDAPDRPRYTLETEHPEENAPAPSLYRWFWGLFE